MLGGALFAINKIFNVSHTNKITTINEIMGVANDGTNPPSTNNFVCLFGVGTGGCGESPSSVKPVGAHEREIMNMIPIRMVQTELPYEKYWFRKSLTVDSGMYHAYYLKSFENISAKVLWKDAPDNEDGSTVDIRDVYLTSRSEAIESFVEMTLRIDRNDCKEYFELMGNVEVARINSIGLFTGVRGTLASGKEEYRDVQLFSKINFVNELMQMDKSMNIIYRVYTV